MARHSFKLGSVLALATLMAGCVIGPKYERPAVQTPPSYKESAGPAAAPAAAPGASSAPSNSAQSATATTPSVTQSPTVPFRVAQPGDAVLRGKWWEMFNDPQLNALEDQVDGSNQSIAQASAAFFTARALVREARSQYYPTVTTTPSIERARTASTGTTGYPTFAEYSLPGDASWVPDLWGRVRNTVESQRAAAQVSAADLENTRLSIHAEVAVDYYNLRGQDALKELLDTTVVAYQQSLDLTRALYDTGIDSDESVAQAETQLESVQAEDTGVGIARAQYEHAIAVLVGQPASAFSIPAQVVSAPPPQIPLSAPSDLLERRPDIAAAERTMAEANAQIGIAQAAYYPTVSLTATGGFTAFSAADWLTWPSRVWSIGASLSETLFDAGLRRATVQQFRGVFDQDVASYRETVLAAFQQVEDNLSAARILSGEVQQQNAAVASAQRNLNLATDRYRLGIDPYLNVITAETTLLSNQQTAVSLHTQQMTAAVQLIEALGGGWDSGQLPSGSALAEVSTPATNNAAPANTQATP
jgi:NodT family efflux transporter outer membrane factor (OMF) lipoprotein